MNKNSVAELRNIIPFKEDNTWYFSLYYKYEDEEGEHLVAIPKAALPFSQEHLPSIKSESFYFNEHPYIDCNDSMPLYEAVSSLAKVHGHKDPACYFDIITKPAFREMTLDEIEKKLGYKIKIINKKE